MIQSIHQECLQAYGRCLLTINRLDAHSHPLRLSRVVSSDPQSYPVGGFKDKPLTAWTRQVLIEGRPYLGEGPEAIRQAFDDAETILTLGWRSVINQPLKHDALVVGSFNLLIARDTWPPDATSRVEHWASQALPDLLDYLTGPESSRTPRAARGESPVR